MSIYLPVIKMHNGSLKQVCTGRHSSQHPEILGTCLDFLFFYVRFCQRQLWGILATGSGSNFNSKGNKLEARCNRCAPWLPWEMASVSDHRKSKYKVGAKHEVLEPLNYSVNWCDHIRTCLINYVRIHEINVATLLSMTRKTWQSLLLSCRLVFRGRLRALLWVTRTETMDSRTLGISLYSSDSPENRRKAVNSTHVWKMHTHLVHPESMGPSIP